MRSVGVFGLLIVGLVGGCGADDASVPVMLSPSAETTGTGTCLNMAPPKQCPKEDFPSIRAACTVGPSGRVAPASPEGVVHEPGCIGGLLLFETGFRLAKVTAGVGVAPGHKGPVGFPYPGEVVPHILTVHRDPVAIFVRPAEPVTGPACLRLFLLFEDEKLQGIAQTGVPFDVLVGELPAPR